MISRSRLCSWVVRVFPTTALETVLQGIVTGGGNPLLRDRRTDVHHLARRVAYLQLLCIAQFLVLAGYIFFNSGDRAVRAQDSILRGKGLIIEDATGRPRVLLGAPFPSVSQRSRQDATTHAMVFLDEDGHDRLTLGESPNPQVSGKVLRRIARHVGVVIHDAVGDERGAYGYLTNGRVVVTLDRPGHEAWAAIVNDKTGFAGMSLLYPPGAGKGGNAVEMGTEGAESFVRVKDIDGTVRTLLRIEKGKDLTFQTFDSNSRMVRDLTGPRD